MNNLFQDLRYGARMLLRKPGFTLVAALTLALGIGVNTVVFSYLNAVMYRILRFSEPDRIAFVWSASRAADGGVQNPVSAPDFLDWRDQAESFEQMSAMQWATRSLTEGGEPEIFSSAQVTTDYFETLGVKFANGRAFLPEESRPGENRVAILRHGFWQRRFGGDPKILQQTITLDGERYTVVGIAPADFQFVFGSDLWEPLVLDQQKTDRNRRSLTVFGRLKSGVTAEQAGAEMESITGRLAQQYPATNAGWSATVMTAPEVLLSAEGRQAIAMAFAVVIAVLIIACVNIANLQFARGAARQKEIAIRLALGASRFRLIRQLLTENLLLALLGSAIGLLLAMWAMSLILARYAGVMSFLGEAVIDLRVLVYTMLLAFASALVFGLFPAIQSSRPDLRESLKEGGRSSASGGARRIRSALVIAEISLALVLLVVAGLLIRTMINFTLVEPGFDTKNLLTMRVSLPERDYATEQQRRDFFQRAISQIAAQPGVNAVGAISRLPLAGGSRNPRRSISIEGRPASDAGDKPWALDLTVTPGYFEAIGISLKAGRLLSSLDDAETERVVVISETMARKYWPNEEPLGRRIRFETPEGNDPWLTIAGVVVDARNDDADQPPLPQIYLPHLQNPVREMSLLARTTGDPLSYVAAARARISAIDGKLPVYEVNTMERMLFDDLSGIRIVVELLGVFAALALVLAAVGIYGVMSYTVTQRAREIGIRMALGAQSEDVMRLVVGQGLKLVAVGMAIGLTLSFAVTRLMGNMLFGVSASDPLTFAVIAFLLIAVALIACYIPARRAARVDPMIALRYE